MPSVTLEDVSKATGFSVPTVSRVLSNSTYPVSFKTRSRILETAQALGYRPNLSARSLRTERTNTIGILIDNIMSPFAPPIVRGIQDYFGEHDISCLVMNSDWRPDLEHKAIESLLSRSVDGIIFAEYSHMVTHEALTRSHKPHVFVHRLFGKSVPNSIIPDDYYGACLAVQHLLALGHRRIGYIGGPAGWHSNQRRFGAYRDTLARHGIAFDATLVQAGDWDVESGYDAAASMFAQTATPTAIFAANDAMALGAMHRLHDAGQVVPDDVAIVGYDNLDFARIVKPKLTSVSMPVYHMGKMAAAQLHAQINGDIGTFSEILVQGRLYVRESCGADPALRVQEDRVRLANAGRDAVDKKRGM